MRESPPTRIYCAGEKRRFPADQFRDDPTYGKVHKVNPEHTTLGEELGGGGMPVLMVDKRPE